jgi:phosphotriesterase-related protein
VTTKTVRTVLGDIDPARLGFTLAHEHVIQDHYPIWGDPDLTLTDEGEMSRELALAREAGIASIGELSTVDTNHDLDALTRVAHASGASIIGSTGWFYGQHLPPLVREGDASRLAEVMEHDILVGTAMTGARAGVIGEIGWSARQALPAEEKVFEAAAIVHGRTGIPIYTHTTDGTLAPEEVDFLSRRGVDPRRIAVSHMDTNPSLDYQLAVARRGAYLSFDRIGSPQDLTDDQRVELILRLLEGGHVRQILLAQDTARQRQLAGRGGRGYAYLVNDFLPRLRRAGVDEPSIRAMTVDNPRDYFAFAPPR